MQEHAHEISIAGAGLWPVTMENLSTTQTPGLGEQSGVAGQSGLDGGFLALTRQFMEIDQVSRELQRLLARCLSPGRPGKRVPEKTATGRYVETLHIWMKANASTLAAAARMAPDSLSTSGLDSLGLAARALEAGPGYLEGVKECLQEAAASFRQIAYDRDCRQPQATLDRDTEEACKMLNKGLDSLEAILSAPQTARAQEGIATHPAALSLV